MSLIKKILNADLNPRKVINSKSMGILGFIAGTSVSVYACATIPEIKQYSLEDKLMGSLYLTGISTVGYGILGLIYEKLFCPAVDKLFYYLERKTIENYFEKHKNS